MKRNSLSCSLLVVSLVLLNFPRSASAQERANQVIVPAGTLLRCTLNEPNFSTKTAEVGDPAICPLSGQILFDRPLFPRGAYLGGHLEAAKDPGHFVGKGYLKLEFDHIGLPEGQVPVPAKVVGAKGHRVDRQGNIVGHGHPARDTVEWMIPPLWPWKVVTLPRRGPFPTLQGEQTLVLRLMDDVALPLQPLTGSQYFGRPSSSSGPSSLRYSYDEWLHRETRAPGAATTRPPTTSSRLNDPQPVAATPSPSSTATDSAEKTALALRSGETYLVTALHQDGDQLTYTLGDGTSRAVRLDEVDWAKTFQQNAESRQAVALERQNGSR